MPKKEFSLTEGQEPRFRIEWQPDFRDVHVFADGEQVGGPFDYAQLREGQRVPLERGHELLVRCDGNNLDLRLDGALLAGSDSYPAGRFRVAYRVMYIIGAIYLVLGCASWLLGSVSSFDFAGTVGMVLLLVILGFLSSRRWMSAMVGGGALLLAEISLGLLLQVCGHLPVQPGAFVIPAVGAFVIFRGVFALRELRSEPPELPLVAGSHSGSSISVPLAPREP